MEKIRGDKHIPDEHTTSFEEERTALGKIDIPADKLERTMKAKEEAAITYGRSQYHEACKAAGILVKPVIFLVPILVEKRCSA